MRPGPLCSGQSTASYIQLPLPCSRRSYWWDDASTDDHLKTCLDEYVQHLNIVRVLCQSERKGFITARLLGAQAARGEALTFLDSHCECLPGWLEPLLARIAEQPRAVVSPVIATIDQNNLRFRKPVPKPPHYIRGHFDWRLKFGWEFLPEEEEKQRKNETDPIRTPTFAGGLFSVSKSYFEHIGTYDGQMEFWGDLAMWRSAGDYSLFCCRAHFPQKEPTPNDTATITCNLVCLAEVWMDEYKWVFYRTNRNAASIFKSNSFGDVAECRELRERLKCRNFTWYLNNIDPEAYVPDVMPLMHGQYFEYTSKQEVRLSPGIELCLHAASRGALVSLEWCPLKGKAAPQQEWIYTENNHLKNPSSGKCLTVSRGIMILTMCKSTRASQRWVFIRD